MRNIFRRKKHEIKKAAEEKGRLFGVPASVKQSYFMGGVVITLLIVALFYFAYMMIPVFGGASRPDTIQTVKKAKEIQRLVDKYYLFDIDEQAETDYMYVGQIAALGDKYSAYYTKEQYASLKDSLNGEYMGIGVTIMQRLDDEAIVISDVSEDSPAEKAGIKPEDIIREINGSSTEGLTSSDVSNMIRADEDGTIELVLYREAEKKEYSVSVTMDEIELHTVNSHMLNDAIGYLQITQFTGVTKDQYDEAFSALKKAGMKSLIIDLRDNPGGLVDSACDILSGIVPKGDLVYQEDKAGKQIFNYKNDDDSTLGIPLVLLVNSGSASAAEIFTGAVKDYGEGTVIGEQTFGKGIVQNYFQLSDGSAVRLTVTKYFTPKGNDIHKKGISPDVAVEEEQPAKGDEATAASADKQLQKAIELLNSDHLTQPGSPPPLQEARTPEEFLKVRGT